MTNETETSPTGGSVASIVATPFSNAIVVPPSNFKLPEQGPWVLSAAEVKHPLSFTVDLVQHRKPMFLFLWNSLSSETQSALEQKHVELTTSPRPVYKPGSEMNALLKDLNGLIKGNLIYDDRSFAKIRPYLSGDTVKLLGAPVGADVARLNRLLIEDAFPLDITPRPKILLDPFSQNYVFVDFANSLLNNGHNLGGRVTREKSSRP